MPANYDLIVIGGGSGGLACAQRAADHGAKVALVEPRPLGGTCVNVGCVPKKVMFYAANIAGSIGDAPGYGFKVTQEEHDWHALKLARDAYVQRLNGIYAANIERRGIAHLRSSARFGDAQTVVAGDKLLAAGRWFRTCPVPTWGSPPTASSNSSAGRGRLRSSAAATSRSSWLASSRRSGPG
jgi:glutathione reductase (NADPH)